MEYDKWFAIITCCKKAEEGLKELRIESFMNLPHPVSWKWKKQMIIDCVDKLNKKKKMKNFDKIKKELIEQLNEINYDGDLSDIGNEIGIIVAKYFDESQLGYEKNAFMHGLKHGISLTEGTH